MNAVKFKEANKVLNKPESMTDEECKPLHIFNYDGECISLWKPSFKERIHLLFYGKIWVRILSGTTQPPITLDIAKTVFEKQ